MARSEKTTRDSDPDAYRMTLGEHLDELRGAVIRSLLALVLAALICIWPAKYLLAIISRPVVLALRRHNLHETFLQTSPVEGILVYVKVVVIFGLILAAPYVLYQLWSFAATGLYRHEKIWIYRLVPASVGLFVVGVLFMYTVVLVVALNFLVGFAGWLPLPNPSPTALERTLLGMQRAEVPASQPTLEQAARVPFMLEDPNEPPLGMVWVNVPDNRLKVQRPDGTYSVQLLRDRDRSLLTPHFKIGEYLSFVLVMTIAFGLAFQMPLVVVFLAATGIVSVDAFRRYRKVVILSIVVIAGILAPPDLLSHLLLSLPMWLLFELGLVLARRYEAQRPARRGDSTP